MKPEAMALTTTLTRLRAHGPCADGYEKLLRHLGGPSFDHEASINLLTIFDSNGVADCLWALRATEQNCDLVARLMACDFAETVLPIWERYYPRDTRLRCAIEVSRRFARGEASREELATAGAAAWDAANDAAWDAADGTVRYAADDAARYAAWDAQAQIIREYLIGEDEE